MPRTVPTYRKRIGGIQAVIRIAGHKPEHRMFATLREARRWAQDREEDLRLGRITATAATVGDALRRYARDVSPTKRGARWERIRLAAIERNWKASRKPIAALSSSDVAAWRDARLQTVKPGTVARDMNLLGAVFSTAMREWKWISSNPFSDVRKPKQPPSRRRRITDDEIRRLCLALGYEGAEPQDVRGRIAVAFLFALETAMRAGEILGLNPQDIHADYVDLPRSKNGDARTVPLSKRARELLRLLPANSVPVFGIKPGTRDMLWRRARDATGLDVNFHDSRAEAIWRLSKKLDVLQLARMIGHRDINSLRFYYAEHASETAKRLG